MRHAARALFKWASQFAKIDNTLRFPGLSDSIKVYVDAKILNVHDVALPREAYVGYFGEGGKLQCVRKLEGAELDRIGRLESDDAEILAILFAIEKLKCTLGKFTIVCDHESVVSEANKLEEVKNPSVLMEDLREALRNNRRSIRLEALRANPAHGIITAYVNKLKSQTG
jgi:hypothetical protein